MVSLAENCYGKSRVRLAKVTHQGESHEIKEWSINIFFSGDYESCFTDGINSSILPTDTMKNTVYALARDSAAASMEEFGRELIAHFLANNPHASEVRVELAEKRWQHLLVDQNTYSTAFEQPGRELDTARLSQTRGEELKVIGGLSNLVLLKTAKSGFEGYIKDRFTTLPETKDRLFGTEITAWWTYRHGAAGFANRGQIRSALLRTFAEHDSLSVQHTLFAMAQSALEAAMEIADITLTMPNKHYLLADLSRFGQDNPNHIFIPTDEPHGYIEAKVQRAPAIN